MQEAGSNSGEMRTRGTYVIVHNAIIVLSFTDDGILNEFSGTMSERVGLC